MPRLGFHLGPSSRHWCSFNESLGCLLSLLYAKELCPAALWPKWHLGQFSLGSCCPIARLWSSPSSGKGIRSLYESEFTVLETSIRLFRVLPMQYTWFNYLNLYCRWLKATYRNFSQPKLWVSRVVKSMATDYVIRSLFPSSSRGSFSTFSGA